MAASRPVGLSRDENGQTSPEDARSCHGCYLKHGPTANVRANAARTHRLSAAARSDLARLCSAGHASASGRDAPSSFKRRARTAKEPR